MTIIHTIAEAQDRADRQRSAGRRLVLVPTMGALHRGHIALVREAFEHGDDVTVSIFVNPTQFAPGEDFERYPRTLEEDVDRLEEIDPGLTIFAPSAGEMYPGEPDENLTWVEVEQLDQTLCGRHREGHFRGVTTVVAKLFNACKPHAAVFGLKDAQQFVVIRRMAADLLWDVKVIGVPTVREPDGLAHSSRNAYLTEDHRRQAVVLSEAVNGAERLISRGEQHSEAIVESMLSRLRRAPEGRVQYVEVVDADSLQPVSRLHPGRCVLAAVAVFFGETRLIDSTFVRVPESTSDSSGKNGSP